MIFDYMTEFAGYLNDRGYAVTQDKISRFLSLKNEETDFTREAEIIPLMKLCFCRNKEEANSFADYFHQYIKDYKGSYAREKERIRKEHQEQMEYSKSQKEKTQKEITGVRQEIEEKRKAVLEEKEMLHISKTQKNYLKKQEVKFKRYFTKREKDLLLSLSKDQTELSEDSKKTFQSLRKKLPEKAEKALLSGKIDVFEICQNIFKILEKAKIQVIYYEKYIEDKITRETKELKDQQIELENKLQRLEREEKRIQVELDSRLFALTRQFTEKPVSKIHRKTFVGGGAVQLLEETLPEFMEKPFKKLDKKEKEYIYQYIRQNIISFKTRLGRYLNTQERRKIDMGKTIQAAKWNQGDSIASVYAAFAPMYEIQTPADLIRFISQIR